MEVAIDVGYGYVKAVSATGTRIVFPAIYAPDTDDAAWNATFGQAQTDRIRWIPAGGAPEDYWVGEAARRRPGARRPWADRAVDRAGYAFLVDAALAQILPATDPIALLDVAVGLPLALFSQHKAGMEALLRDHRATVESSPGHRRQWTYRSVTVMPQAAGAYYAATARHPDWVSRTGLTVVVDVGYRTTDYFVIEPHGHGIRPVRALSGSFDWGLVGVTETVRRDLERSTGHLMDPLRVEAGLAAHPAEIRYQGTPVDLEPLRRRALVDLAHQVLDGLRGVWGPALSDVEHVIVAGGGAAGIVETVQAVWPDTVLADDPMMANALGFLTMLQMQRRATTGAAGAAL